jgi:hypothetical protein
MIQMFLNHPFWFTVVTVCVVGGVVDSVKAVCRHRARTKEMQAFWNDKDN